MPRPIINRLRLTGRQGDLETGRSRQIFEKMNKFGQKLSCLILMRLTQITKNSLTDKNYCLMNFDGEGRSGSPHSRTSPTMPNHRVVKIPTICLKFPHLSPSPRLLIYFVNETALLVKEEDLEVKTTSTITCVYTVALKDKKFIPLSLGQKNARHES